MDFPDKTVELPPDMVTDEQISAFCLEQTARLDAWIEQQKKTAPDGDTTRTRYDGTVRAGCRIFQEHRLSPFNLKMKFNTQKTCLSFLRLIEATGGTFLFRNVTVPLVQSWYEDWRSPDFENDGEHVKRAHEGVSTFRQVAYFLAAMRRYDGVAQLAAELKLVTFERASPRTQQITYQQILAFCAAADDMVAKNVLKAERALYMKIGVTAQFETILRQKDIIGEWARHGDKRRLPVGINDVQLSGESWAGYFTWESIHGWRWVMKTSKSKFRKTGDFNLQSLGLLFPLLEQVPHHRRRGAVVKGEHGLPIRQRTYIDTFRRIARWAKIPDDVWNMDSRAGGATEAHAAGADMPSIQGAMTHGEARQTHAYIRGDAATAAFDRVAEIRQRGRKGKDRTP